MSFLFYTIIMFKCMTSWKRRKEQLTHDILRKCNVMDDAWRLTTSDDKPKHYARKAYKRTRMVVGMI